MHVKEVGHLSQINDTEEEIVDLVDHDTNFPGASEPSIADLQKEILELKIKLVEAQNKLDRSMFRLENIKDDDGLVKYYTGFADYETLMAFYEEILESDASVMRQWSEQRSEFDYNEIKAGPPCKLPNSCL